MVENQPNRKPTVLTGLPTLRIGGAERVAFGLIAELQGEFEFSVAAVQSGTIPASIQGIHGRVGGWSDLLFRKADLIHTHLFLPGLLARVRRLWDRTTPWVHTVHFHDYRDLRLGLVRQRLDHDWILRGADVVVVPSPEVERSLPDLESVVSVRNGLDLSWDGDNPLAHDQPLVLGTVSMLRKEKGLEDLVRAAAYLRGFLPKVKVRIAGDGPGRRPLETLISRRGLEDVVELSGYIEDLPSFYKSLHIYVQPSRSEGFGMAALEAFRFGLPLVVTEAGNLPALVGEGRWGLVVQSGSHAGNALGRGILTVWANLPAYSERARGGFEFWRGELSVRQMASEYATLFRELIEQAPL